MMLARYCRWTALGLLFAVLLPSAHAGQIEPLVSTDAWIQSVASCLKRKDKTCLQSLFSSHWVPTSTAQERQEFAEKITEFFIDILEESEYYDHSLALKEDFGGKIFFDYYLIEFNPTDFLLISLESWIVQGELYIRNLRLNTEEDDISEILQGS